MNKGFFQGCHITMLEDLIPIYPWAIIALFSVVEKIIPKLPPLRPLLKGPPL